MNVVEVGYDCYGPSFISSHASVVAELVTAERNVITLRVATVHCSDSAAILSWGGPPFVGMLPLLCSIISHNKFKLFIEFNAASIWSTPIQ